MTLKVRLATMMIFILVAVLALQFLFMERDRRHLLDRLQELGSGMDRTTSVFVQQAHRVALGHDTDGLATWLREFAADSTQQGGDLGADIRVLIWSDSLDVSSLDVEKLQFRHEMRLPGDPLDLLCDSLILETEPRLQGRTVMIRTVEEIDVDSGGFTTDIARTFLTTGSRQSWNPEDASRTTDMVINLPLPGIGVAADSFLSVQVRYPLDALTEELASSRRRNLYWLAAILAIGIFGTTLVAAQFTRPIRTLQDSFRRVVQGDLDHRVTPERKDEIGRLTHSFNEMVGQLRQSKEVEHRLADAERLAAVGQLAAGVAHEVRNPLNTILLTMHQLRDKVATVDQALDQEGNVAPSADFEKYYTLVTSEIARLEKLVSDFLDLSKSGELTFQRIDIVESLRSAVTLFQPEAERKAISIELETPETLPADGDPSRLPMVWNNLLSNALAASPEQGRIRVLASLDNGQLTVAFEDEGPGIPETQMSHIWEPFYSGRDGGTGLGLAVVRSIVERHGGRVEAANRPGGGARVAVVLPESRTKGEERTESPSGEPGRHPIV